MKSEVLLVILMPFVGTVIGSAGVFFLKGKMGDKLQRSLTGFAAGVMVAASVWSLIIPAMNQSEHMGKFAFVPALIGVWLGFMAMLFLDSFVPHMHINSQCPEGKNCNSLGKSAMMVMAVALHNLPEGMAVGVVAASWLSGNESVTFAAAVAFSIGIAIQNMPEGAIISMPLKSNGMKKGKAFGYGVISGAVEPLGAIITILLSAFVVPVLPYLLSFAAGAMLYVVVEELIPEMSQGKHSNIGTVFFAVGFTLMMVLDVALG
ncbi:MAG: ZIP family metal transporter [Oscillospiraceae bacterium]|nr:ZIP family metal transporter [Oscillospiraceae bacterium]